uniref:Glucose-methanol-choline oxidoreductase N-terminal domain-containing protein n=1 Tax=Daphnia galeata TaxID=27404 RepID=A0A8J2WBV1_9CRUS|nr:unnamed protein product [Daphnia galeata]
MGLKLWLSGLIKIPAAFAIITVCYFHFWFWNTISYIEVNPASDIYDFIVVGAGSAGGVIASRLSEDPTYSVLLIEAGGYPSPLVNIPLISSIFPSTPFAWNYQTEPQKFGFSASINHRSNWPRGKGLGGSSILNFLLYVRGNKYDYDHWAALGNEGWNYEDVLPYFIKSENNRGIFIDEQYHGKKGNLIVEDRAWKSNLPQAFINAGLELGYPYVDINGKNQTGFTIPQLTTKHGARWSTYSAFLKKPYYDRPNLKVITFAEVKKVLINESKQAYGIQYKRHGNLKTVFAAKEIILSAGAIASPQILMLSGIGPKEHLERLEIKVHSDLRVGENLQDHIYVPLTPLVHNDSSASLVNPFDLTAWWDYFIHGTGQYTSNGVDGMAFKSSRYCEPDWPDIQLHFLSYSAASDHGICVRHLMGLEENAWQELFEPVSYVDTASIFATLVRPKSRGWIRLRSADPLDQPIIDPQFYSHPQDVQVMLEALLFAQETLNTTAMKKYLHLHDARLPYCKDLPVDSHLYLECLIKYMSATLHHSVGTCKMGPSTDREAVVDSQLRVYGIKGLRVADASVIPVIPNGNINAPVIMIGEKAAHMILEHHKNNKIPKLFLKGSSHKFLSRNGDEL